MNQQNEKVDPYFFQLVLSFQVGAMQQMGKVASPLTGKIERDISAAKVSIDMLGMIETKTKGNLTEEEQKLIAHVLYELRLNYVEELKKEEPAKKDEETPAKDDETQDAADTEKSDSETSDKSEDKANK